MYESEYEIISKTTLLPIVYQFDYLTLSYWEITINLHKPIRHEGDANDRLIRFFLTTDYGVSVSLPYEAIPFSGIGFNMPFTLGDEYIIKRIKQNNIMKVSPFTEKELYDFCSEIKPFGGIGTPHKKSAEKFNYLKNSIVSMFYSFSNRRIWLFMDRGNEIGNNAEALFRYCANIDDGIQKYYIIPNESYAERFKGLPYMIFGTLEYKLLCCFAEKFISSFLFEEGITLKFGVEKSEKELFEDIRNFKKLVRSFFRGDIIHLQHGIIMQDISFYINKFDEETRLIFCNCQEEYEYVKDNLQHAINEKILRVTGLPKNDYLEKIKKSHSSQRIILFAPSFDRFRNIKDTYNPGYKYSKHFKYLNDILASGELITVLERKGYAMYFKPHYALRAQMKDFDIDSRITVVGEEIDRYDLYVISDLMITDYSSIAFDFAYLKKPVIYTHFLENPKFEETYFSYQADGFGEVCQSIDALVETIDGYLNTDCEMKPDYQRRVDKFFTFQDGNNCERVYQEILKLPDTRKNIFNQRISK
jgi:hypothetical protein